MFEDSTIFCSECAFEGCEVSEVHPPKPLISMAAYAAQHKNVMDRFQEQHSIKDRNWAITCPTCGFVFEFTEYARRNPVYLATPEKSPAAALKLIS